MRKRQLYIASGIAVAVAITAIAIFAVTSMLGGDSVNGNVNGSTETPSVENLNVELGDGDDLSSHGMSSDNMTIVQQNENAAENDAEGENVNRNENDNMTEGILENENVDPSYDPYIDAMRVDISNVPVEERKGNAYLDRDQMRKTIETVVPILFDTASPLQRKQALSEELCQQ